MTTRRLTMIKAREILRQKWVLERSHREVARCEGISAGVVGATLTKAIKAGLSEWSQVEALGDEALEQRLYRCKNESTRPLPDCAYVHAKGPRKNSIMFVFPQNGRQRRPGTFHELHRSTYFCTAPKRSKPDVTLQLLHCEYPEANPLGYQYTRFCDLYRDWLKRRRLSMRQVHKSGEKMFVDFAGRRPKLVGADPLGPRNSDMISMT